MLRVTPLPVRSTVTPEAGPSVVVSPVSSRLTVPEMAPTDSNVSECVSGVFTAIVTWSGGPDVVRRANTTAKIVIAMGVAGALGMAVFPPILVVVMPVALYAGIQINAVNPAALASGISRTVALYNQPGAWKRLQTNGMKADFSWGASGAAYAALYRQLIEEQG